jgi:hypothetical protein
MATLKNLRAKYTKLDLDNIFQESVAETKSILIELLRSQIESGEYPDSSPIGIYSSLAYAKRKQKMGSKAPFGIIDLKYTGRFLDKLVVKKYPRNYLIRSTDKKNSMILRRFGPMLFELSNQNLDYYINKFLLPTILKKIK